MAVRRARLGLTALAAIVLVTGCTGPIETGEGAPSADSSTFSPTPEASVSATSPVEGLPTEAAPSPTITANPSAQPAVKLSDGPPWRIEGEEAVSVLVAAPAQFAPGAEFSVPAKQRAVIVDFEMENEGESVYYQTGFTAAVSSSDPCQGFAYLSEGVSGVPEVVDPGTTADFKYGYFCKGKKGDKLTLKVALDPNSPTVKIKTTIP